MLSFGGFFFTGTHYVTVTVTVTAKKSATVKIGSQGGSIEKLFAQSQAWFIVGTSTLYQCERKNFGSRSSDYRRANILLVHFSKKRS